MNLIGKKVIYRDEIWYVRGNLCYSTGRKKWVISIGNGSIETLGDLDKIIMPEGLNAMRLGGSNADKIRDMDDEQLADFIANRINNGCARCPAYGRVCADPDEGCSGNVAGWLAWLQADEQEDY